MELIRTVDDITRQLKEDLREQCSPVTEAQLDAFLHTSYGRSLLQERLKDSPVYAVHLTTAEKHTMQVQADGAN